MTKTFTLAIAHCVANSGGLEMTPLGSTGDRSFVGLRRALLCVSPSVVSSGSNDSGLKRSAVSNFEFGLLGFICNLFFGIWNFLNLIVDD
jgi:hypothetical protein